MVHPGPDLKQVVSGSDLAPSLQLPVQDGSEIPCGAGKQAQALQLALQTWGVYCLWGENITSVAMDWSPWNPLTVTRIKDLRRADLKLSQNVVWKTSTTLWPEFQVYKVLLQKSKLEVLKDKLQNSVHSLHLLPISLHVAFKIHANNQRSKSTPKYLENKTNNFLKHSRVWFIN